MTRHEAAPLDAATFTPQFEELLLPLSEASEALVAMIVQLAKDPMLNRVDRCFVRTEGIRRDLHQIHTAVQGEGDGR